MTELEFLDTLKHYDKKLNVAFLYFYNFERIYDWYEKYPSYLIPYNSFIGSSFVALEQAFLNVFSALFDGNSNETILKLFDKAQSESWADIIIGQMCNKYKNIIIKDSNNRLDLVKNVLAWRNRFYDHYDKEAIYISDFQALVKDNSFDFESVNELMIELHKDINTIFEKSGRDRRKMLPIYYDSIDEMFLDLLKIAPDDAPEINKSILDLFND